MAGNINSEPKLPVAGYLVFGLMTCWLFTLAGLYRQLYSHMRMRSNELGREVMDQPGAAAIYRSAFILRIWPFLAAGLMYSVCAGLLAAQLYWYRGSGENIDYRSSLQLAGLSLLMFYLANFVFLVSVAQVLRVHELAEYFLLRMVNLQAGVRDPVAADELKARWDRLFGKLSLFLLVSLPLVFIPQILSELIGKGLLNFSTDIFRVLLALVGIIHAWGTALVVGLYNSHVMLEDLQLAVRKRSS